jgi:hypothetical protein
MQFPECCLFVSFPFLQDWTSVVAAICVSMSFWNWRFVLLLFSPTTWSPPLLCVCFTNTRGMQQQWGMRNLCVTSSNPPLQFRSLDMLWEIISYAELQHSNSRVNDDLFWLSLELQNKRKILLRHTSFCADSLLQCSWWERGFGS